MSDYDFFVKADLSHLAGKWVAVLDNKVIASGTNFKEVAELVDRKYPTKKPLLTRIPEKAVQLM